MINKRRFGIILVIVLIAFLITAAFLSFNDERGTKLVEPRDTHLRVYTFGPVSEENYFEDTLEIYKNNNQKISTDLRVVPLPPPTHQTGDFVAGYEYLLLADFSAQDPPDIFTLNSGRVPAYTQNGALLDLSPYLSEEYKQTNNLPFDEPIYSLPFYDFVDLVAAFSTAKPQETVDLLVYLSLDRTQRDLRLAREAEERALEAARRGAGILERIDDQILFDLWNNYALSLGNDEILIDEDSRDGQDYLISHEQAFRYPYMVIRFSTNSETGEPQVLLVFNDQYMENPTLVRNMSDAIIVLIRSIHRDIGEGETKTILEELGLLEDSESLSVDLDLINETKTTTFGDYEFSSLKDPVSRAIRVVKLPE